jgi:cytochrome c biogenesis factor
MSTLKSQLAEAGVSISNLSAAIAESYGNTYTALTLEAKGETPRHSAVRARIEKIREYLGQQGEAQARVVAAVRGTDEAVAATRARYERQVKLRADHVVTELEWEGGSCGDVLVGTGTEGPCTWTFLGRVTNTKANATWYDVSEMLGVWDKDGKRYRRSFRCVRAFEPPAAVRG